LHLRNDAVSPAALKQASDAGLRIRVWTVNEPGEFDRLAGLGVEAVFTDFPERFLHKRPAR
jgi:glycerophosphoryl diester phosphodiesterase